jgi:hypothetical protein
MKAYSHPWVVERSARAFDLVHADLIPLDSLSFGGARHMLLIMDDFTRYAWGIFCSKKDAPTVSPILRDFTQKILTQYSVVIKRWRTDGGTGEFSNSFFEKVQLEFGQVYSPSTPHVKQQNGVVERRVQHLKDMERSMRAGAGILDDYRFQAEALATVVIITNLLPSKTLDGLSLFYCLRCKQLPLDFVKPWGCLVYVKRHKDERTGSSDPQSSPSMLISYVKGSTKVYKYLDLYTLQSSNHSDVKFDEDLFPGPWIKRPANMKLSMLQKKNLPGSAVDTRLGQAVSRPPMPSILKQGHGVPLSLMNPF